MTKRKTTRGTIVGEGLLEKESNIIRRILYANYIRKFKLRCKIFKCIVIRYIYDNINSFVTDKCTFGKRAQEKKSLIVILFDVLNVATL